MSTAWTPPPLPPLRPGLPPLARIWIAGGLEAEAAPSSPDLKTLLRREPEKLFGAITRLLQSFPLPVPRQLAQRRPE